MPPLSGAEVLTPGSARAARSYLLPSIQYTGYADTEGSSRGGVSQTEKASTFVGSVVLQRVGKHSELDLNYAGGGFFYTGYLTGVNNTSPNGTFQELAFTQTFSSARWKWLLGDEGAYLPESSFGFGGFGGLSSFGLGATMGFQGTATALNPTLAPDQTILTGRARRLSNLAVTELDYQAGARSSFTVSGAFGTLQFLDPGFLDSNQWILRAGYNYSLSPRDVISIMYDHFYFRYHEPDSDILYRGFELAYGHKITGRLSLQLSAGPMTNDVAKPLGGSVLKSFISTYDALQYHLPRVDLGISFMRFTTSGAGVLFGAETDLTALSAARQLTRQLYATLDLGHAFNQALFKTSASQGRAEYETWQAGVNLSREFGQHMSFYFNYYVQHQISTNSACFGNTCRTLSLRQVGGVGINLHTRPIRIG
jgi:hypothetical protein